MGALISLPMTGILAVPLLSSYSTSLNVLFFTLNWYILLLTNPPLLVELYGLIIMRLLFFLLPALAFLAFDTALPSLAVEIKAQGALGLPNRRGRKKTARIVAWSLFNTILGVALQTGLELLCTKVFRVRSLLSLSRQLPLPWTAVKSVLVGLFLRGVLQYIIHRFVLHNPRSPISKLHTTWQHSIPAPYSLAVAYDHPLAYLIHHWVPLYLPAIIFRTHLLPFLAVLMIVSLEELITYSGYSILPSTILIKGMARRTDNHFIVKGQGNFAAFGGLDWCCGTSVGGDVVDDLKAEWDKHNMDDKVSQGANNAGDLMESVGLKVKNAGKNKRGRKGS